MSRPAMAADAGAGREADMQAVEAQFPGWEVSRTVLGRWYAARREPLTAYGCPYRPQLGADGPAGLCAAIKAFGR